MLHPDHDLAVFEACERPGGHANTVRVETESGTYDVDTGFIVFNDRNYPNFERILDQLSVPTQPSRMSFGVSDGGGFEYNGSSPNGLFATRANIVSPAFHRMILDLLRFNREARELLASDEDLSLSAWLERRSYSTWFIERLIVPQASAVWSADPGQMWSFPARFMVEFFDNHGMLGFRNRPRWRTITGGSRRYVEALTRPLGDRIRPASEVTEIQRRPDGVTISVRGAEPERFDAVVIATHSDQALSLLADPSDSERELLGAIPYQPNEAVLHTDRTLLPRRRRAWASWNYHLQRPHPGEGRRAGAAAGEVNGTPPGEGPGGAHPGVSTVTYHMNSLQSLDADREFCVTLNRTPEIDPGKIIATFQYAHPVYTPAGVAAQGRHAEISGHNRTHYCGAYWGWGFHEDGVRSALRVVDELGSPRAHPVAA
jgi:predicted NAD/FAD-binding protein